MAEQDEAGMQRGEWAPGDKGALICCGAGGDAAFLPPNGWGEPGVCISGRKFPLLGFSAPSGSWEQRGWVVPSQLRDPKAGGCRVTGRDKGVPGGLAAPGPLQHLKGARGRGDRGI